MLNSEKDWTRAVKVNRIYMLVALLGLLVHIPLAEWLGLEVYLLRGILLGLLVGSLIGEFWTFRKPDRPPTRAEIEKLDRENLPVMLISTLATWGMMGCFIVVSVFDLPDTAFWAVVVTGTLCLLVALCLLPRLMRHMRASRVAPELYDERSRQNLDKAYRHGFNVMFQAAFLGGVVLMYGRWDVPAGFVAMGIGLVGIMTVSLLWCWYDWRDSR